MQTFSSIQDYTTSLRPEVSFERIHAGTQQLRVVCFPHAGGSSSWFHAWKQAARKTNITLEAVRYPGHAGLLQQEWANSIAHLAALVNAELEQKSASTVLLGHSMGALVAFEVALQAEARGVSYAGLHLSGSRPPSIPLIAKRSDLDDTGLVEAIGCLGGGTPNALECEEIAQLFLPIVRHDFRIAEDYLSEGRLAKQDLHVYCGRNDFEFLPCEAPGWQQHTYGIVAIHAFDGGHFFLEDQGSPILANILDSASQTMSQEQAEPAFL